MEFEEVLEAVQNLTNDDLNRLLYSIGAANEPEQSAENNADDAEEPANGAEEPAANDINRLNDALANLAKENADLRSDISKLIDSGAFFKEQENSQPQKSEEQKTLDALFEN